MRRIAVPSGAAFGHLTVIAEAPDSSCGRVMLCQCECGTQKAVLLGNLRSGNSKSCGCHGTGPGRAALQPGEVPLFGKRARGRIAQVDLEDHDLVMRYRWHVRERDPEAPGRRANGPYAVAEIYVGAGKCRTITMHALIMGQPYIDHVNGEGLDNRRPNLRPATHAQNGANARKNPGKTSRYKGVFWDSQKSGWVARITPHDRQRYLGVFASEEGAGLAYDVAAREAFGEFAKLNFSDPAAAADAGRQAIIEWGVLGEKRTRSEQMVKRWSERQPVTRTCVCCGGEYESMSLRPSFYCSTACRGRWRRQQAREQQQEGRLF